MHRRKKTSPPETILPLPKIRTNKFSMRIKLNPNFWGEPQSQRF